MNQFSSLTKSLIFHGIVIAIVSGTFLFKDEVVKVKETPIEISFVTEENPKEEAKKKPEPVKETPPPLKKDKPKPAPKALEKPEPPKKAEVADKVEEKKVERTKPKTVVKKPKNPPKPKPTKKKPKPKKEIEDKKDTKTDFMSVLKNLQDSDPVDTKRDGPKLTQSPTVDRMTTGELDAFRMQLSQCWNILPGAAQAETLAVNLTINVNKDRTVRDVQITDRIRYQSDTFFRAAADNAIRAIKHPDCTPLDLPADKYSMWNTITLNFDPQTMF
jgi:hypothetical protein